MGGCVNVGLVTVLPTTRRRYITTSCRIGQGLRQGRGDSDEGNVDFLELLAHWGPRPRVFRYAPTLLRCRKPTSIPCSSSHNDNIRHLRLCPSVTRVTCLSTGFSS